MMSVQSDDELNSSTPAAILIQTRDIPVPIHHRKYLPVWHRAFAKIRCQLMFSNFSQELQIFGTTNAVAQSDVQGDAMTLLKRRDREMQTADELGQIKIGSQIPFCMFHPHRKPKQVWSVVLAFLLLYTATVMPYRMAWIETKKYDDWFWVELTIDALFFCDFLINCFSAYIDSEGRMITNRKQILISYAQGWMALDLMACFPFSFLEEEDDNAGASESSNGSYKNFIRLLRLPRLYRLFRITRILKIFKVSKTNPHFMKLQDFFRLNQSTIRLAGVFVSVAWIAHISACLWFFMAKLEGFGPDTWVYKGQYLDDHESVQYMLSLYWAFTTMSTVGYGDITGGTMFEMTISIVLMIFGVCFFSFTIGSLASIFNRIDSKEAVLNNKMAIIDEFAKESQLDTDLKLRLRHSLQYTTEKTGFSWADKQHIFNELPRALRYEVAIVMHQGACKELSFFQGRDQVFVYTIVPFLAPLQVTKAEILYSENEYADEIYFIVRGRINYVYENDHDLLVYKSVQRGAYFGDIEVIKQISRKYKAQAAWNGDLLIMNKALFGTVIRDFPQIAQEMNDICELRDKVNSKAKAQLINYLKQNQDYKQQNLPPSTKKEEERQTRVVGFQSDITERLFLLENQMVSMTQKLDKFVGTTSDKFNSLEQKIGHTHEMIFSKKQAETRSRLMSLDTLNIPNDPVPLFSPSMTTQADESSHIDESQDKLQ